MRCYYILLLLMILSIGCSTTSGGKSARGGQNLINAEKIEQYVGVMTTAYDVIRVLRPNLLESSNRRNIHLRKLQESGENTLPIEDSVYLDGAYFGKVRKLEYIPVELIGKIQYLRPAEAHSQYGFNEGGGVFEITTKQFKPQI